MILKCLKQIIHPDTLDHFHPELPNIEWTICRKTIYLLLKNGQNAGFLSICSQHSRSSWKFAGGGRPTGTQASVGRGWWPAGGLEAFENRFLEDGSMWEIYWPILSSNGNDETGCVTGWWFGTFFFRILGMSSSQLTLTPSFFRGVSSNLQPDYYFPSLTI